MVLGIMDVGCGCRGRNLNGMVRKGSLGRSHLSKDQKNVRGSLREDTWGRQKSNCKEEPGDGNMPDASGEQQGGQHGWSRAPEAAAEPRGSLWEPTLASLSAVDEVTGGLWSRGEWPNTLGQTRSDSYRERLAGSREWEQDWRWGFLSCSPKHLYTN